MVRLSSVSNYIQDSSCCDFLLFHPLSWRLAPAAPWTLVWPLAVPFHHILWPLLYVKSVFWHIFWSILHQLLPAVLRNSNAYQLCSKATFYRCIGRGCTQVLQLGKYNRLAVHINKCFQMWWQCGWVGGVQWGIVVSWQITHHVSLKRDKSIGAFTFHKTLFKEATFILHFQNAWKPISYT